jgi:hypothetical protein
MTFSSEETRHRFHCLPAASQYEWVMLDEQLAGQGEMILIESVCLIDNEVRTRIIGADGEIISDR